MSSSFFTRVAGWLRGQPLAADAVLAAGLLGFQGLGWLSSGGMYMPEVSAPVAVAATIAGLVPIVIRRKWLRTAIALTVVLSIAGAIFRWSGAESMSVMVLTYTVAAYWPLRRALAAVAVLWPPSTVVYLISLEFRPAPGPEWLNNKAIVLSVNMLFLAITLFVGLYMHTRRSHERDLQERTRIAETTRQALADQAVADERRRIARELHDVVAHHVSVMGILATGARRSMSANPGAADAALATIEETGRTTLRELRRLLNILRADDDQPDLAPQPGLTGVESLVEQLREAGLRIELVVEGEPYDLDPGVALTIFRIVQEALTNTLKHAGQASSEVRLGFGPQELTVEVLDDGRGPGVAPNQSGHGLVGIRERVALYGGQLRLGPRPGGGFRVAATIPVDRPGSVTECE
ncbi:sensor histidine kinase [Longispora albida]|uniref:sensor histidine kinase n=1 Tax=Longispora albida TaxID=203523 RepID=UPI00037CB2DF|nr:sensor histidine kinase [Longispora albida]